MYHSKIKTQKKQKKIHQSNRVTRPELIITIIERGSIHLFMRGKYELNEKKKSLGSSAPHESRRIYGQHHYVGTSTKKV